MALRANVNANLLDCRSYGEVISATTAVYTGFEVLWVCILFHLSQADLSIYNPVRNEFQRLQKLAVPVNSMKQSSLCVTYLKD